MSQDQGDTVEIRRLIRATPEELFDAWIDPDGMRTWMCPGDVVSADIRMEPRIGGSLSILMRTPTQTHEHTGEFRAVERPSKLAFTWTAANLDGQITLVTVQFLKVSGSETEMVLTHERIPRKEVRDRYQSGWAKIAGLLADRFEGASRRSETHHG
jgi:uncharacterized protein YndB with AHSA1/START domain